MTYSRLPDIYDPATDGVTPPVAWAQQLRENQEWRYWKRPTLVMRKTVVQSIPHAVVTGVTWDDVVATTDDFSWVAGSVTFRFPTVGVYLINGYYNWATSTAGNERIALVYNGDVGTGIFTESLRWSKRSGSTSGRAGVNFTHLMFYGGSNDALRWYAYQDSGAALNLGAGSHLAIKLVAQG